MAALAHFFNSFKSVPPPSLNGLRIRPRDPSESKQGPTQKVKACLHLLPLSHDFSLCLSSLFFSKWSPPHANAAQPCQRPLLRATDLRRPTEPSMMPRSRRHLLLLPYLKLSSVCNYSNRLSNAETEFLRPAAPACPEPQRRLPEASPCHLSTPFPPLSFLSISHSQ